MLVAKTKLGNICPALLFLAPIFITLQIEIVAAVEVAVADGYLFPKPLKTVVFIKFWVEQQSIF